MKIIVTRPAEDAAQFADCLRRAGATPVLSPVMRIEYLDADPSADQAAFAFTSANGVRAFARRSVERSKPAFVVGEATAAEARAAGFADVRVAGGDVDALAGAIAAARPASVLHVAGTHRAGDLAALLTARDIPAERATLYEAHPIDAMTDEARAAFATGAGVAFFSPRSVELFERQARAAGFAPPFAATAYCFSETVARAADGFARRVVAETPNVESLCARIATDAKDVRAKIMQPPATAPSASQTRSSRRFLPFAAAFLAVIIGVVWLTRRPPAPAPAPQATTAPDMRLELPAEPAAAATAAEKILNAQTSAAKPEVETLDRDSFPDAPINKLPPAPTHSGNANAGLQEAAKAAAELFKDNGAGGDFVAPEEDTQEVPEGAGENHSADKIRSLHATGLNNSLMAQSGAKAVRAENRGLIFAEMQWKIAAGEPFADTLQAYLRWGGEPPDALIADAAARGAATYEILAERFAPARDEALALGRRAEADGAIGKVGASVASTFSVRPAKPIAGASTVAIISRAEDAVARRDFRRAIEEIDGLRPPASGAFDSWRADAAARIAVDDWIATQRELLALSLKDAPDAP
jgi:uroporphyrinogen-III synthase